MVTSGAVGAGLEVRDAFELVTEPTELVITTLKSAPLSAAVVAAVAYVGQLEPELQATLTPFLRH